MPETRIQEIYEDYPDASLTIDESGVIVLANHQTEKLFGYSHEEIIGMSLESLLPDQAQKAHVRLRAGYEKDPRTREMASGYKFYGKHKDGHLLALDISLAHSILGGKSYTTAAIRQKTIKILVEESNFDNRKKIALSVKGTRMKILTLLETVMVIVGIILLILAISGLSSEISKTEANANKISVADKIIVCRGFTEFSAILATISIERTQEIDELIERHSESAADKALLAQDTQYNVQEAKMLAELVKYNCERI